MVDLFRYIEHDFAVPAATDAIDVTNQSDFQTALRDAGRGGQEVEGQGGDAAEGVRMLAENFLTSNFESPTDDPTALGRELDAFDAALRTLPTVTIGTLRRAVSDAFGKTAQQVVNSAEFTADRELLENSALAVKLITGFDRIDSARVVRQLRAAAFLQVVAAGDASELTRHELDRLLGRPLRIPPVILAATTTRPLSRQPAPGDDDGERDRRLALREERGGCLQHRTLRIPARARYRDVRRRRPRRPSR